MAAAAAPPGGASPGLAAGERLVCVDKNVASPKLYVLEPWIADLLVNYEQLDERENFLAGQVVRILSDSAAPGQPGVLQDAVVQVSDGSCYIRVVITSEALQAEEKIIVLQKYTVCFQDEARLEDCEFYLTAQQFIVLPMQRQRMESSDGNQDPSVLKKIKELWLKNLAVRNAPSSEPSVSQLIDAIGQNQLEILKENAEECLDLWKSKEKPVTMEDEVPITQWEAERKKEGEDVFMVPVSALVIPPEEEEEEEAVVCDSSEATSAGYTEKSFQLDPPLKTQKDVPADSNTTDLLEACSRGSPEGLPPGEPVQTSSPSLLRSHSSASPVEISTSEAAGEVLCAAQGPQGSRGSQAPLPALSPVLPVLPSSSLQSPPGSIPRREHACSSGTASSADALKPGLAHASTKGGETVGNKRKLMEEDERARSGQQHPPGTSKGKGRGTGKRSELMGPRGAKKSRKEAGLQRRRELEEEEEEEEEQVSSARPGPSSRLEQCRAPEPVNMNQLFVERPPQYQYEAPSPELCQQVQSIRISKAMLKWACWILTEEEEEEDS
ncbi:hypothetical protein DUI87_14198 [Hirundo rustica rustica]|uniref:Shelterin complex subunit TPP1/Est3 domain-containing protein n=1 Tax=Hirundo rustica rustica TaxID=333673 RepID=A0A3M0K9I2_HIRRU|nr:hypothetical protein DUI87_14198 [Hirundo rustica rustica]